jgi:hypothetical protein
MTHKALLALLRRGRKPRKKPGEKLPNTKKTDFEKTSEILKKLYSDPAALESALGPGVRIFKRKQ